MSADRLKTVKPFLKWAGGKSQILNDIREKYPRELGSKILKYAEPFLGGGAVLFDILSKYDLKKIYISDINKELILTYKYVRDNVKELINKLYYMEQEFLSCSSECRAELYYKKRDRFNSLKYAKDESTEIACLFIFLNRTCFNGLYRVNANGEFNVPIGKYKNPLICDRNNLLAVSKKLKGVRITCKDFSKSQSFIDDRTFVYFDPPYRPISASSTFNSYSKDDFNDESQKRLARFIDKMSDKGALILASNSDPKNNNKDDDFFDKLYSKHNINRISASRMINSEGSKRGKINELLISNY